MDKNVNVYTSSEASLRQVITMLFDRTVAEYLKNGYFSPTSYNNFMHDNYKINALIINRYQEISPRISAQPNGTTPSQAPLEPPAPTVPVPKERDESADDTPGILLLLYILFSHLYNCHCSHTRARCRAAPRPTTSTCRTSS